MVVITSFGHCNVRWYCRRSRGLQTKKLSGANSLIDARRLKVGRTLITTKRGEAVDRLGDCLCVEFFFAPEEEGIKHKLLQNQRVNQ